MVGIVPESWLECDLGTEEDDVPRPSGIDMLTVHNPRTTNPHKAQETVGELVNHIRCAVHAAALDKLPEAARLSEPYNPLGGQEARPLGRVHHKRLSERRDRPPALGRGQRSLFASCRRRSSWDWAE